jgi:hypothetical protein
MSHLKTEEDYQAAIQLTNSQSKAFGKLKAAIALCKKTNILFYQNLETLGALNGNNVAYIGTDSDREFLNMGSEEPCCLQFKDFPIVTTSCSFADDNHFIKLL